MLRWLTTSRKNLLPITTDVHSHLLPGLDDGVSSFEQAVEIILHFKKLGYTKLITTPHVMSDHFRNTRKDILDKLTELQPHLASAGMRVEAAAEYYADETLVEQLQQSNPLLTFGDKYLLFETNFITEPFQLKEFIFLAQTNGYKPVMAHPERYLYLQDNWMKVEDLLGRGVLFQVNINSISGYYSKNIEQTARKLIDKGWVHFLGSDCHNLQHIKLVEEAQRLKYFQKALSLPLLNHSL